MRGDYSGLGDKRGHSLMLAIHSTQVTLHQSV